MAIISFSQIVEANGKTIRENNLERIHKIPLGTLVEVKFDRWFGKGACIKVHARLFVYSHDRDCDGTPLYSLSKYHPDEYKSLVFINEQVKDMIFGRESGFNEDSLKEIKITEEVKRGEDCLQWKEDEKAF